MKTNLLKTATRLAFLITILLTGMSRSFAQAPGVLWASKYGSTGADRGYAVAVDASGNVFTVGSFTGSATFGAYGVSSAGANDGYVSKTNAAGTVLWVKKFGGTTDDYAYGVACDASGNVFVTGDFKNTATFGTTSLTATGGAGTTNLFVTKLDASGNFLWAVRFGGGTSYCHGESAACDASGNVFITGNFNASSVVFGSTTLTTPDKDAYLVKINGSGTPLWAKQFGGTSSDFGYSVTTDASGNCYTTGACYSATATFDTFTITGTGTKAYMLKTNSSGTILWVNGTPNYASGMAITTDGTGTTYATGRFSQTTTFGAYSATPVAGDDVFITKTNSAGGITWVKTIGSTGTDTPTGITADANGAYVLLTTGATMQIVTGVNAVAGNYVVKVGTTGTTSWAKKFGDSNDGGLGIKVNPAGNIYFTGFFAGTADFDATTLTSYGGEDIFLTKLAAPCINTASTITQTACTSYTLNGTTYSASGTYTQLRTNAGGCDSTITINLTIGDATAPVANLSSLPDVIAQCSVTSLTAPTATDNCSGTRTGTHNTTLPITTQGTTVVTWTYADGNGNSSTQTQNVVITDNTAPVATVTSLPAVTAQCSVTSLVAPTAIDNCSGIITGTHNATLPITAQGTTPVTWTYTDANGNSSTQIQNVIITDNIVPVADQASLPAIISACSVTSLTAPTATDNCSGTITGVHNATLPITTQGTTVVTWTYTDANGNSSTQTQNVVIEDNVAPLPDVAALPAITDICSVASLTTPTATDNCAGSIMATTTTVFPVTTQGTTVVTWTYSDGNGNTTTQTQNVIIADNVAPLANAASLPDVTASCSVSSLVAPTATDNCAGTLTGTNNATLPITAEGTTVITWTYNDGHGNTSTQNQNVIITLPVATTTLSGLTITATTSGATYQWIDCANGNTPISGETSQSFTASLNGSYAVEVTENGCTATSTCTVISTVGINEVTSAGFALYPNPNSGAFTVVAQSPVTLTITDITGKVVSVQTLPAGENKIEMGAAENGIYFVSVRNEFGAFTVKRLNIVR